MSVVTITATIAGTASSQSIGATEPSTTLEFDVPAGTDISSVVIDVAATATDPGSGMTVTVLAQVAETYIQ